MAKTALLLGASGLVGGHCLRLLLEDPDCGKVLAAVRRPLPLSHPKLEQHVVDFDRPESRAALPRADEVYCCLGTTIKKAGSPEAFRKVDFSYPLETARAAAQNGARAFLLVSANGADPKSRVFYNRIKGELEIAVSALPFEAVRILRPSLLLGERKEFRLIEKLAAPIMIGLSFVMVGPWKKYRPVEAKKVARALLRSTREGPPGTEIWESDRIAALT